MNITVLFSTPTKRFQSTKYSITDEETEETAKIFQKTLQNSGHNVTLFPLFPDNLQDVKNIHADCIFNLIEWTGTDIALAQETYTYLDTMHIPYTGSRWYGYVTSSQKELMKQEFNNLGIPTPGSVVIPISSSSWRIPDTLHFPLLIKTASDHCSIGLTRESLVHNQKELEKGIGKMRKLFPNDVLVEEFINGREFQVTVIEQNGKMVALPMVEIIFHHPEVCNFLTYGSRWDANDVDYLLSDMIPARPIPNDILKKIVSCTKKGFRAFKLHDYARFDIRMNDNNEVFFLEVNANPGFDDSLTTGVTLAAHLAGIEFEELLEIIITSAISRRLIR